MFALDCLQVQFPLNDYLANSCAMSTNINIRTRFEYTIVTINETSKLTLPI